MRWLAAVVILLMTSGSASAQVPSPQPDPSIADGSAQAALDAARERWREVGVRDYAIRVRRSCFCPPAYTAPVRIVVRGRRPDDPPRHYREVATVARQFRVVQEAIDDGVERLVVSYGARGRPLRVYVDQSFMTVDEEVGYTFRRFRELRPR